MNTRQRIHCNRHMRGFTLLELLVAIMIVALIMTTALGAVRLGGKSLETAIERTDSIEEMRAVTSFLRRQFVQIIPNAYGEDRPVAFYGDSTRVEFVAPAPLQSAAAGLLAYKLTAEDDAGNPQLMLTYAPFDVDANEFAVTDVSATRILAEGFDTIAFEYFGNGTKDSRPSWQDHWPDEEGRLPQLVRIRLSASDGRRDWPELIFGIRARGDDS